MLHVADDAGGGLPSLPPGRAVVDRILGFAGAMAIYLVLPEIGKIYDRAKLNGAGGEEAFAALQPGAELQRVLAYAAQQSFQVIALIPLLLFVIFGAVWLAERRHRGGVAAARPSDRYRPGT